jgi:hypothetical protein
VRDLLGHSTGDMSMRYAHLDVPFRADGATGLLTIPPECSVTQILVCAYKRSRKHLDFPIKIGRGSTFDFLRLPCAYGGQPISTALGITLI